MRSYKFHLLEERSANKQLDFVNGILFSGEVTFCLNGFVNCHNCHFESDENPHWMKNFHSQDPRNLNVWCR